MRTTMPNIRMSRLKNIFNHGFLLIELMIGMTIGLFIISAISVALMASSSGSKTNDRTAELQMNGRYALQILKQDLQHAGFLGLNFSEPSPVNLGTITSECAAGFVANLRQRIWGANDNNPFSATCIPSDRYSQGDILVVRRLSLNPVTTLAANTVNFRSAFSLGKAFVGATPPAPATWPTPWQDHRVEVLVYYVSPCTNSPCENPPVPALYRLRLGPGPAMTTHELVASGVENMQIRYARLSPGAITQFYDASNINGSSVTTLPSEWDEVTAVNVSLLVRNTLPESGYTNSISYTLGDQTVAANDQFRRQVFNTVVQLRNAKAP